MNVQTTTASVTELESDAMVAGIFSDGILGPALAHLDAAMDGLITRLVARKEIIGQSRRKWCVCWSPPGLQTGEVVVVGLGDRKTFGQAQAMHAAGAAAKQLAGKQRNARRLLFRSGLGRRDA